MKNLKITLMAFMALFLGIGLASCGDDKDEPTHTVTTVKTDVTAHVLMTEDLATYFDGKLTITVKGASSDYTLKKSEGTVMKVNGNYNAYLFKVVVEDVELSSDTTIITGKLTYTRNETAAPTVVCDFLDESFVRFTAPNTDIYESGRHQNSHHGGISVGHFEKAVSPTLSVNRTAAIVYSPNTNLTIDYSNLVSAIATSLNNYSYTYSY